jgi:hypothetical protein
MAKLKLVEDNPPDPAIAEAKAALAAAISARTAAEQRVVANAAAIERLVDKSVESLRKIEAAEDTITGVKRQAVDFAADPSAKAPEQTIRVARETLSDALEFRASLKEAREALEQGHSDLKDSVGLQELNVARAVGEYIRASAKDHIAELAAAYAEHCQKAQNIAAVLGFLEQAKVLPAEFHFWNAHAYADSDSMGAQAWRSWAAALHDNSEAVLAS